MTQSYCQTADLSSKDGDLPLKCQGEKKKHDTSSKSSSKSKFQKAHSPGWKRRDKAAWMHQSDDVAETRVHGCTVLLQIIESWELCKGLGKLVPHNQIFGKGRLVGKMRSLEAVGES